MELFTLQIISNNPPVVSLINAKPFISQKIIITIIKYNKNNSEPERGNKQVEMGLSPVQQH